ncbi:5'-nucleotidase C-terminal domain-containing protein [Proteiniborus sp. MB09-C3]|uniref:5'-nucleotidase C-terminal domain-containing protein n=1 Tax=Proteiniborus sp. MB09-C3 TaxID=3050072 RepID=UPI00255299D2|nr:5'-nucleotidase C-terminal domain-containing protein [Proteiniborus sp. MB09-C3]WIV12169.1 5'-nucleotidase C-terminal domain-containing protein [Proteiniborus sp. MB09-C3]
MNFKKTRILSLLVMLSMVLGLVFAPVAGVYAEEAADNAVTVTIVHTNDTHSRVADGLGFAKVATKIKAIKEANPNVLVIDAGDTLHGQTFATISKGESIVKVMNAIGYDVMTPGNHDFNYGQERLLELKELMNFSLLSSNLVKEDGTTLLDSYVIKEVGGLKIGIFGLSTPETAYKTNPKNVEGLTFADPVEAAKKIVAELKEKNVDAIIAVAHLGIDKESVDTSYKVRDNVEGIDLIIDGHSHSALDTIDNADKATKIVSTGEYNNNLGIVELTFQDGKLTAVEPTLFSKDEAAELETDATVAAIITEIEEENKVITSEIVAKTDVELDGVREHVRGGETNLSNLITDAMLAASGADMAITNGGGIRASIKAGDITMGDIITVLPFGNYVIVKEYTGAQILAALEHGTKSYPDLAGSFAQVAGATFTLDLNEEAGKRVKDVKIGGEALDLDKIYKVATNDFMAVGGDDYVMFKEGKLVVELQALDEVLIDYVKGLDSIPAEARPRMTVIEKVVEETPEVEEPKVEEPAVEQPSVEEPKKEEPAAATTQTYVVKPGDVLWKIAKQFGTVWEKLAEFNSLKNPHLIFPGQQILIPAN